MDYWNGIRYDHEGVQVGGGPGGEGSGSSGATGGESGGGGGRGGDTGDESKSNRDKSGGVGDQCGGSIGQSDTRKRGHEDCTDDDKNAAKISVVAKTMSDITFRPILSSYDPSPWYEQDDVPSISPQEYGALLSAAWGTRVVFVPPPSPTHRDREKWLSSFWGCSEDSEESISEVGEHRGMEVVPEVGGEDFGAEDVGAEVVGAEHVGAGHRGIQVAVEEGLGEDLELIPVPSQALFFHLTPAEVQTLG